MPALLLDEHLTRALARALNERGVVTEHVATWLGGRLRTADDETILLAAQENGSVLVTLDSATLPALAKGWTSSGRPHAGLLIVSHRISQRDIGGQLNAILKALDEMAERPWTDTIVYARRRRL
ncbi:MAG TPA: DUF5615 family PIN-like protein [Thermomicrobiales bacterium]|nr:DUF5615 family PIN-like protein [Thermomicrobiales bacterium]